MLSSRPLPSASPERTLSGSNRCLEAAMANLALNLVEATDMYPTRPAVRLDDFLRGPRPCSPSMAWSQATGWP
jgi:hypothetical protein